MISLDNLSVIGRRHQSTQHRKMMIMAIILVHTQWLKTVMLSQGQSHSNNSEIEKDTVKAR